MGTSAPGGRRAPLYIGLGAAVAGGLALYYLNTPAPAPSQSPLTPEAKAYTRHLPLSGVGIKASSGYFGQRLVEIEGRISNAGERNVETVEIFCVFYDRYGQHVLRQRVPIVSQRMGGLRPGETKPFRLPFDEVPESWNQSMPQLVIASVAF